MIRSFPETSSICEIMPTDISSDIHVVVGSYESNLLHGFFQDVNCFLTSPLRNHHNICDSYTSITTQCEPLDSVRRGLSRLEFNTHAVFISHN
jgi:hypothetical protein